MEKNKFKYKDLVTYKTRFDKEQGKVKSVTDKFVYVVFKCGGDWDNFENYTAQSCSQEDLVHGWV